MRPDILFYVLRWIGGFCSIIDGVFTVLAAGFYNPNLTYKMVTYSSKRSIDRKLKK